MDSKKTLKVDNRVENYRADIQRNQAKLAEDMKAFTAIINIDCTDAKYLEEKRRLTQSVTQLIQQQSVFYQTALAQTFNPTPPPKFNIRILLADYKALHDQNAGEDILGPKKRAIDQAFQELNSAVEVNVAQVYKKKNEEYAKQYQQLCVKARTLVNTAPSAPPKAEIVMSSPRTHTASSATATAASVAPLTMPAASAPPAVDNKADRKKEVVANTAASSATAARPVTTEPKVTVVLPNPKASTAALSVRPAAASAPIAAAIDTKTAASPATAASLAPANKGPDQKNAVVVSIKERRKILEQTVKALRESYNISYEDNEILQVKTERLTRINRLAEEERNYYTTTENTRNYQLVAINALVQSKTMQRNDFQNRLNLGNPIIQAKTLEQLHLKQAALDEELALQQQLILTLDILPEAECKNFDDQWAGVTKLRDNFLRIYADKKPPTAAANSAVLFQPAEDDKIVTIAARRRKLTEKVAELLESLKVIICKNAREEFEKEEFVEQVKDFQKKEERYYDSIIAAKNFQLTVQAALIESVTRQRDGFRSNLNHENNQIRNAAPAKLAAKQAALDKDIAEQKALMNSDVPPDKVAEYREKCKAFDAEWNDTVDAQRKILLEKYKPAGQNAPGGPA